MILLFLDIGTTEFIIILIILLGFIIYPMLEIMRSKHKTMGTKLMWIILLFIFPFLGAVLYFLYGRDKIVA